MILDNCADIHAKNNENTGAMHSTVLSSNVNLIKLIESLRVDINLQSA